MRRDAAVFVAGGETLAGAAILRALDRHGFGNVVNRREAEPDPTDGPSVGAYLARHAPEYVFHAAGRSGGIGENVAHPASLMRHVLLATVNVLHGSFAAGARRLLYFGSSCGYPRDCPQPMAVPSLMTGPLEPTSEPYAMARLSGLSLCRAYRAEHGADFLAAVPPALFGPGDDFSASAGHVVPALLRKMDDARRAGAPFVEVWGTGRPRREFLYADDFGDGAVFLMEHYRGAGPVNLAGGETLSVGELAALVKDVTGYGGELRFDPSRPDGAPLKTLDASEVSALGWRPATPLREALRATYAAYLAERDGAGTGTKGEDR